VSAPKHPAKFTDTLIPIFAAILKEHKCKNVFDPLAGTGKLVGVLDHDWAGHVFCNELEAEWCDLRNGAWWTSQDAGDLDVYEDLFDAICTSPAYGNRLADKHEAKDGSTRITYKHMLGRDLDDRNTGGLQWGAAYRTAHVRIWMEVISVLKPGGVFILNISDHIRGGKVMPVTSFHDSLLKQLGLVELSRQEVKTPRMGFGANAEARVDHESVIVYRKPKGEPDEKEQPKSD